MRKTFLLSALILVSTSIMSQNIFLTFSCTGESSTIDMVTATNTSSGQSISFRGSETLVLELYSTGIHFLEETSSKIILYPNPFISTGTLTYNQSNPGFVQINICNHIGQLLNSSKQFLEAGKNIFDLSLPEPGIYFISIISETEKTYVKALCTEGNHSSVEVLLAGSESLYSENNNSHESKSHQSVNSLSYTLGDKLVLECTGGWYSTTISDSPKFSKNYEIEFVDCTDPDGRTYKTVKIGDQSWMAENLAWLPEVSSPSISSDSEKHFYVYGYEGTSVPEAKATENYGNYGALYNWRAAIASCPEGWHLPDEEDWTQLNNYLIDEGYGHGGSGNDIGKSVASVKSWYNSSDRGDVGNDPATNNSSGFNALPGGGAYFNPYWSHDLIFYELGSRATFWSSTQNGALSNWTHYLQYSYNFSGEGSERRKEGHSVRCILGSPAQLVITSAIRGITESSAIGGGDVLLNDTSSIEVLGVCWSTGENPTITDEKTADEKVTGKYTSEITGLTPRTKYFVRSYFTDIHSNTFYGDQLVFTTVDSSFIDSRDSITYGVINIGEQNWMAENLKYLTSEGLSNTSSEITPAYFVNDYYGNSESEARNLEIYKTFGVLYNWEAAKTACPDGWHLPYDADWTQLSEYLIEKGYGYEGSGDDIGKSLASNSGWKFSSESGNIGNDQATNNTSGFNALPGGFSHGDTEHNRNWFYDPGGVAYFWSSSLDGSTNYLDFSITSSGNGVVRMNMDDQKISIRCIQDREQIFTTAITNITESSASAGGNILYLADESEIGTMGVCWSTKENPSIADSLTIENTKIGRFTSKISGLKSRTTYYVRAYLTKVSGNTLYGSQEVFSTVDSSFIDSRDSTGYGVIKIGNQDWMAENLAYLPSVCPPNSYSDSVPSYFVYGYKGSIVDEAKTRDNYRIYGVLYNWPAAEANTQEGGQDVCPDGWHLPSEDEWNILTDYLVNNGFGFEGDGNDIGKSMASKSLWTPSTDPGDVGNDQANNNSSGFNALPGGYLDYNTFTRIHDQAAFWSSTPIGSLVPWKRILHYGRNYISGEYNGGTGTNYESYYARSVRCLRGDPVPSLFTSEIYHITESSGTGGGKVIYLLGKTDVSAMGVCWSIQENPTISDSKSSEEIGFGEFSSKLSGLGPNTRYYVRAYITITTGETYYGNQVEFTTVDGSFIDSRDSARYLYVNLGDQIWMAENLRYLPDVRPSTTGSNIDPLYYVYGYDGNSVSEAKNHGNYENYGVLYNWAAATSDNNVNDQDICPEGWHLPSYDEWTILTDYLIDNGFGFRGIGEAIGKSLASKSFWAESYGSDDIGHDINSNNSSGFNALPGGNRHIEGDFRHLGDRVDFWSSTPVGQLYSWSMCFHHDRGEVPAYSGSKAYGYPVRCLQNKQQVITSNISHITESSAQTGGQDIYLNNGVEVLIQGVCWSTNENPTINDNKTIEHPGSGNFSSEITGLTPRTIYYTRAYITIESGDTLYGNELKFQTTDGSFTDPRDSTTYGYINLGEQIWMAENLAYLPSVNLINEGSDSLPYFYVYDYSGTNIAEARDQEGFKTYGVLYNWNAAVDACPDGWHLPYDEEWTQLTNYLSAEGYGHGGSGSDIGKSMASTIYWNSASGIPNVGNDKRSNNSSGFNALPAGLRYYEGGFFHLGNYAFFWSSTKHGPSGAWGRYLQNSSNRVYPNYHHFRGDGASVRCLKGDPFPRLLTSIITQITDTSAFAETNAVYVEDESEIAAQGVCWSTDEYPTIYDYKTTEETGIGVFSSNITGLSPLTNYYVRAYFTTVSGSTYYGKQVAFGTTGHFTDSRDGKLYKAINIGERLWMAENLAWLPSVSPPSDQSETDPHNYVYDYEGNNISEARGTENYDTYGVLYNWPAAFSACPDGWHLPSDDEWKFLETFLGMTYSEADSSGIRNSGRVGIKLKSLSDWFNNDQKIQRSGFKAIPGGYYFSKYGGFWDIGYNASFWSSSPYDKSEAWARSLGDNNHGVNRYKSSNYRGYSVRCIMNITQ